MNVKFPILPLVWPCSLLVTNGKIGKCQIFPFALAHFPLNSLPHAKYVHTHTLLSTSSSSTVSTSNHLPPSWVFFWQFSSFSDPPPHREAKVWSEVTFFPLLLRFSHALNLSSKIGNFWCKIMWVGHGLLSLWFMFSMLEISENRLGQWEIAWTLAMGKLWEFWNRCYDWCGHG